MTTLGLPLPVLSRGRFASIEAYTDNALFEAVGVRIAFTGRSGGVSEGPFASLNLGSHVNDDPRAVQENRDRLLRAFADNGTELLVPNQVHEDTVLCIDAIERTDEVREAAAQGADGLIVSTHSVAALLCFADCVPVIIVSPTGRFAVVHAGWRGVMNTISAKALRMMLEHDALQETVHAEDYNVYIGPHIHRECFETSAEIHDQFVETFGRTCDAGHRHIDLSQALRVQLVEEGIAPERICDVDICTVCHPDEFFSYRAQQGAAGRHGAFAVKVASV